MSKGTSFFSDGWWLFVCLFVCLFVKDLNTHRVKHVFFGGSDGT